MMKPRILFVLFSIFCVACTRYSKLEKPTNFFYKKAYEFRDQKQIDSAFLYFEKARVELLEQNDTIRAANCMVNMAIISTDVGDLFGGQELSLQAIPYFDENNPELYPYILSNYNNLGITSYNLKQYNQAVEFYNKSLMFVSDSSVSLIIKNNIANAYRKKGDLKTAIDLYKSILIKEKDSVNYARILSNYAYSRWLDNSDYNPTRELKKALQIRRKKNDLWGQNTSYAQLADYYAKNVPDSALAYSERMYHLANRLNSSDDRLESLQKLIPLSNNIESGKYFNTYRFLEDSVFTARANAKNQFALIRYQTEKHKADNLVLQNKNIIRSLWIISLVCILVIGSIFLLIWYRKRSRLLAQKAKDALQEAQLKTSKKVHDVVANGLYRIMSEMENNEEVDQNKILDQMEKLYERSRDISYDHGTSTYSSQQFQQSITEMLNSFITKDIDVLIFGNEAALWELLTDHVREELKTVLQELLVNMRKHSLATSVAVRFENHEGSVWMHYTDNGIGISETDTFSNGLNNTGTRIRDIGGTVNFGIGQSGGLKIQIQIPPAG